MAPIIDEIGKKITAVGQGTRNAIVDFSQTTKLKDQITHERNRINACYLEIGQEYYKGHAGESAGPFASKIQQIQLSMDRIDALERDIKMIQKIKTCPTCGASAKYDSAFCPKCGVAFRDYHALNAEPSVFCNNCGTQLVANTVFCTECGTPVPAQEVSIDAPPQIASPPEPAPVVQPIPAAPMPQAAPIPVEPEPQVFPAAEMAFCINCGAELLGGSDFCVECGTPVIVLDTPDASETEKVFCINCGAVLEDDPVFCVECGTPVIEASAPDSALPAEPDPEVAPEQQETPDVEESAASPEITEDEEAFIPKKTKKSSGTKKEKK